MLCGYSRFDKVYLFSPFENDMIVPTFDSCCRTVAVNVKSAYRRIDSAARWYVARGSTRFRFVMSLPRNKIGGFMNYGLVD